MVAPRISPLDPRLVITGSEGELYSGDRQFLAAVSRWNLAVNIENTRYHPAGVKQRVGIHVAHDYTLTLTETVTRAGDPVLLKDFVNALDAEGDYRPNWLKNFIARIRGDWELPDGRKVTDQWVTIDNCVPDGTINLINIEPGSIIERPWTFFVNSRPRFASFLET